MANYIQCNNGINNKFGYNSTVGGSLTAGMTATVPTGNAPYAWFAVANAGTGLPTVPSDIINNPSAVVPNTWTTLNAALHSSWYGLGDYRVFAGAGIISTSPLRYMDISGAGFPTNVDICIVLGPSSWGTTWASMMSGFDYFLTSTSVASYYLGVILISNYASGPNPSQYTPLQTSLWTTGLAGGTLQLVYCMWPAYSAPTVSSTYNAVFMGGD